MPPEMQEALQNVYGIMAGNYLQCVTESASDKTAFYAGRCYFEVKMLEADLGVAAITVKGIYEGVQSGITRLGTLLDDSIGIGGGGAAVIAANGSAAYAGLGNLAAIGALLSAAPGSLSGMEQRLGRLQENFEKMLESGKGGSGAGKGESSSQISEESKEKWGEGSFDSVEDSLEYHFKEHGEEVGATDIDQYVRKAEGFSQNLRGAQKSYPSGGTPGAIRYTKNGKYIIIGPDGKILSFGLAR